MSVKKPDEQNDWPVLSTEQRGTDGLSCLFLRTGNYQSLFGVLGAIGAARSHALQEKSSTYVAVEKRKIRIQYDVRKHKSFRQAILVE